MYSMIGLSYTQTKNRRFIHNDNKIQECGFGLIPINNFPLGPLLDTPFSCGKLIPHLCPCPPTSWHHILFIKIQKIQFAYYIAWP
jgi:hypothetical protein